MKSLFNRFLTDESGATAIEYALVAAIIGIGIVSGLSSMKSALNSKFTTVSSTLGNSN